MALVIFDCDGVLVDTEPIAARVGAQVLTGLGWELEPQEVMDRFLGCSDEHFRAEVEERLGDRLPPDWEARFGPLTDAAFATELTAVPGVVDVLDALDDHRTPTCVASNGSHAKMRRTLGLTGLAHRFEGRRFSATDVAQGKPAPDLYLHAAATMGVGPAECVVVEDSPRGAQAALAAGMRCLAFAGRTPPARFERLDVTVCPSMPEVLAALRELLPSLVVAEGQRQG